MRFEDSFEVARPVEQVWAFLLDVPRVAPCFPGAELSEASGDTYTGTVRVRVGPMAMEYAGTATLVASDAEARRVVIEAVGRDRRGAGLADATVETVLAVRGGVTQVDVHTDLRLAGRVAQLGGAVLQPVSAALLAQFGRNLQAALGG